jgi:hypothetical protein
VYRRAFAALTFVVCFVTAWAAYTNVLADNSELLIRAREVARQRAACGKCNPSAMHGERGMTEQRMEYDYPGVGQVTVVCRRAWIIFGEYSCEASPLP